MGFISRPFGLLLYWLNHLFGNYGVALIFFTLIVRLILLPLSVKQQKTMKKTQSVQPELERIKEKYKNDKEKLNEETMKAYKKYGVNPMGGCLPLLIQFPIIIGLYQAVIKPLTYMFGLSDESIGLLLDKVNEVVAAGGGKLIEKIGNFQITVAQKLTPEILGSVDMGHIGIINFNFLGLNLGDTPSWQYLNWLWVIPVLAALTTFLSTKTVPGANNSAVGGENSAASTMKTMNMVFPFMTAWFAFSMPAGVGFYWILGNIIQILQQLLLNKYFSKLPADPLVVEPEQKNPGRGKGKKR
ncbi:hypothetical protein FACS189492_1050 [Clostridia bacterium]|nr:hypothetical protein FACS189492_1050 [Clostridia bacterium]